MLKKQVASIDKFEYIESPLNINILQIKVMQVISFTFYKNMLS